jgi:hypothetical protein
MRAQWNASGAWISAPPPLARSSWRAASASGVPIASQFWMRASGPTLYQPSSAPRAVRNGNFM